MATNEEILRLVMEVQGQQQVAALQESLEREEASLRTLITTAGAHASATQAQAATVLKLSGDLQALEQATGGVAKGGGNLNQTVQSLGYAFQDFTSTSGDLGAKLNSISNNIPQLLGGLGQYAAAASLVFTGAIVAFKTFEPTITEFVGKVGKDLGLFTESSGSLIDGLKSRIKELGDKPVKLSADVTALEGAKQLLEQLQAQQKAFADFGALKGSAAEASGALAKDAIAEVPGGADDLQADLAARVARQYEGQSAGLQSRRADLAGDRARRDTLMGKDVLTSDELVELAGLNAGLKSNQEAIATLERTLREQAERTVGGLYARATAGDPVGQRALADLLQGTGVGTYQDLALRLSQVGPESQEAIARTPKGREAEKAKRDAEQAAEKAAREAERQQALANKATDEAEAENNAHAQKYNDDLEKAAKKDAAQAQRDEEKATREQDQQTTLEARRIEKALGQSLTPRYEVATARNQALLANGAPVARNAGQERALAGTGQPYALPPEVLEARLRAQMEALFKGRGATPEGAARAASDITGKGQSDLSRRAAALSGQNLSVAQGTLALTGQLIQQYGVLGDQVGEVKRMLDRQRRDLQARTRSAAKRGQR